MSLRNGLKKRTPLWCWLTVVGLAIVVLPGAVAKPSADEAKPPATVTDGNPVVKDSTSQSRMDEQANSAKSENAGELVDAIRLDEAFALSPNLKPETVVAYVNAMPITVRDVIPNANSPTASAGWTPRFGKAQPPNVEHVLRHHLPAYLYQELLLQHFLEFTPDERQTVVRESLQAPFLEVLRRIKADKKLRTDEELAALLAQTGVTIDELKESFFRMQITSGYAKALPPDSPLRAKDKIIEHCQQLLVESASRETLVAYPVSDLVNSPAPFPSSPDADLTRQADYSGLIDLVTTTVEPDSWGGNHTISAVKESKMLLIRQRGKQHAEIARLLTDLRLLATDRQRNSARATLSPLDTLNLPREASAQQDALKSPASPRLSLATYPVADLVVRHQSVVSAVRRSTDSAVEATPDVVPAAALTFGTAAAPDQIVDVAEASKQANAQTCKADLTPLVELIKASVEPDSWDERGTVAVDEATLSLIIRQSEEAHEEIQELLSQLRDAQDQSVQIPCLVVHLTTESQTKWLEEQCSLHPLQHGSRWALLPPQRCESFTQALLEQKPEVLSRPVVRTISGQIATMTVGTLAAGGTATATTGIRLEVTPHVLPYSNVIRLQHSFSIGEFTNDMPQPIESLVGSGQTLLLLVNDPADHENPDAARSPYLLMMTPEHIPEIEEEAASAANPEDAADAVDDTPRGHECDNW